MNITEKEIFAVSWYLRWGTYTHGYTYTYTWIHIHTWIHFSNEVVLTIELSTNAKLNHANNIVSCK